jgi:outer membrane protein assembly factor BamB
VYALDAVTGEPRWRNDTSGHLGEFHPTHGVSVQGHLLLHDDALYMSAGNQPPVASYALADGTFTPAGKGRGQHLFVRHGQVHATGFPLYWPPDDEHYLTPLVLETPAGVVAVATSRVALHTGTGDASNFAWTAEPYQEIAAVAVGRNALLVAGVNRDQKGKVTESEVRAVRLSDGAVLWTEPLPAAPVAWGLAVDRAARVIVTLIDGQVVAFTAA